MLVNEELIIANKLEKKTCGIVMPISPQSEYPVDHWKDVLLILTEAINQTEFEPKLVSDDVAIGLIHDRIVTNIYNNEIIVCDVSSKNPNVMFELGLRLAFDKPTIIIKDENTGYSFDTGVIEHIQYPSSLRFNQIVKFKEELIKRINATYAKSQEEPNYSPFLKSFGKKIIPATIQNTEIPESKYILNQLESVRKELQLIRIEQNNNSEFNSRFNIDEKDRMINSIVRSYPNTSDILNDEQVQLEILDRLYSLYGTNFSRKELINYLLNNENRRKYKINNLKTKL